jgi:hypothetical protein
MTITYEGVTEEIREIVHHHAVLRRGLERRSGALCEAAESGVPFERLMTTLREYVAGEILPHVEAEERTLYQAASTRARGSELVRALTADYHALAYLTGRLRPGTGGTEAAKVSEWIATLFAGHVAKVNDQLLPALADSGADLAGLLAEMRRPPPPDPASAQRPEAFSQP